MDTPDQVLGMSGDGGEGRAKIVAGQGNQPTNIILATSWTPASQPGPLSSAPHGTQRSSVPELNGMIGTGPGDCNRRSGGG